MNQQVQLVHGSFSANCFPKHCVEPTEPTEPTIPLLSLCNGSFMQEAAATADQKVNIGKRWFVLVRWFSWFSVSSSATAHAAKRRRIPARPARWTDPLRTVRLPARPRPHNPPAGAYTGPCHMQRGRWCTDCIKCLAPAAYGVAGAFAAYRPLPFHGCPAACPWLGPAACWRGHMGRGIENHPTKSAHRDRTRQIHRLPRLGEMSRD